MPYQGSKKKIAKQIVEIIKQNFGTEKVIYDVFGGGGAITAECLLNGLDVRYNDLDETITACFQRVLSQDRDWIKTLVVSREEFFAIRNKSIKTVDDHLKLLVDSFGNNKKGYLYSEEYACLKYRMVVEIIEKHDVFSGYRDTITYQKQLQQLEQLQQLQRLQQLERLQQLQRLQQLERLQQLQRLQQLERLEVTILDYKAFSNVEGAIFYLDPPYEDTVGYDENPARYPDKEEYKLIREKLLGMPAGSQLVIDDVVYFLGQHANNRNRMYVREQSHVFKSQDFYDWAVGMSKRNIVLISSYEISDPRFSVVYEFSKARSTFQGGASRDKSKTERLFMVTGQYEQYAKEQLSLF